MDGNVTTKSKANVCRQKHLVCFLFLIQRYNKQINQLLILFSIIYLFLFQCFLDFGSFQSFRNLIFDFFLFVLSLLFVLAILTSTFQTTNFSYFI
jgi:hypothetical protein